ncbi:MAG TPA: chlororespiratory reduction protein 7 [Prochlorococcus sp.]|jgi:hypothetical protein|nr:chlororespiratory reduction protein 7 [Prochlorococcaceae cyanobacterium ETNP2_MAG_10]
MSDSLIRASDHYVVLEPGKSEQLLSAADTLDWLQVWLQRLELLPQDLQSEPSLVSAAQRLLDTACELEVGSGLRVKWFAVRLTPPGC